MKPGITRTECAQYKARLAARLFEPVELKRPLRRATHAISVPIFKENTRLTMDKQATKLKRAEHARREARDQVCTMLNLSRSEYDDRFAANARRRLSLNAAPQTLADAEDGRLFDPYSPTERAVGQRDDDGALNLAKYVDPISTTIAGLSRCVRAISVGGKFDVGNLAAELESARDQLGELLDAIRQDYGSADDTSMNSSRIHPDLSLHAGRSVLRFGA